MLKFFQYNWQVRDEWFNWCESLPSEELHKERVGGVGSILYTLYHIIDVEYSWLRAIQGKEDKVFDYDQYDNVESLQSLFRALQAENKAFLKGDFSKEEVIQVPWDSQPYKVDDILHHLIAHEIHHIGQLSVWSRELNKEPVPANFVGRDIGM